MKHFLKNIWAFRKQLWSFRWWDYSFTLEMMEKCLEIMSTKIEKDGIEITRTFHRHTLSPGADITNEDPKVQAIANAVWTEEVIAAYQASLVTT
jgi:hypothetical protein